MQYNKKDISKIQIPQDQWEIIRSHCRRKIDGRYLPGESKDKKAFGIIGGQVHNGIIIIDTVFPLFKNARSQEPHKQYMDKIMATHAIPSETPLDKRGWVAAPEELESALQTLAKIGSQLMGTYHMHRVSWENDKNRDLPTTLDTILAEQSRMFMFIVSMVEPENPGIKAFFEGITEQESLVEIVP